MAIYSGGTIVADATNVQAPRLTGNLPAISGASLTGVGLQGKCGYWSVDLSTLSTSDTQVITGVGFTPIAVGITTLVNSSVPFSVGFQAGGVTTYDSNCVNAYQDEPFKVTYNRDYAFAIWTAASDIIRGKITTLGADGFTVTYTVQNTPSGTGEFLYMALG